MIQGLTLVLKYQSCIRALTAGVRSKPWVGQRLPVIADRVISGAVRSGCGSPAKTARGGCRCALIDRGGDAGRCLQHTVYAAMATNAGTPGAFLGRGFPVLARGQLPAASGMRASLGGGRRRSDFGLPVLRGGRSVRGCEPQGVLRAHRRSADTGAGVPGQHGFASAGYRSATSEFVPGARDTPGHRRDLPLTPELPQWHH